MGMKTKRFKSVDELNKFISSNTLISPSVSFGGLFVKYWEADKEEATPEEVAKPEVVEVKESVVSESAGKSEEVPTKDVKEEAPVKAKGKK